MIMCIVVDICDTLLLLLLLLDMFFTFPPAGPQTKGLVKSLDFPTQLLLFFSYLCVFSAFLKQLVNLGT